MRDYFLNLLQNLDKLTGMKQYEKLMQMSDYKKEINTLLDILCRVCEQFPFIPDEAKKQIINDAVISDGDFIGLNAKFIAKSLNLKKEFYMNLKNDVVIHPEALTGEAREKRLGEWLKAINGMQMLQTTPDPYAHIRAILPNDGQVYTPHHQKEYEQQKYERQRHFDYIQDNFDSITGKKLPTAISEEEYNKIYDETMLSNDIEARKESL